MNSPFWTIVIAILLLMVVTAAMLTMALAIWNLIGAF